VRPERLQFIAAWVHAFPRGVAERSRKVRDHQPDLSPKPDSMSYAPRDIRPEHDDPRRAGSWQSGMSVTSYFAKPRVVLVRTASLSVGCMGSSGTVSSGMIRVAMSLTKTMT
jgi:hypothetical protein